MVAAVMTYKVPLMIDGELTSQDLSVVLKFLRSLIRADGLSIEDDAPGLVENITGGYMISYEVHK